MYATTSRCSDKLFGALPLHVKPNYFLILSTVLTTVMMAKDWRQECKIAQDHLNYDQYAVQAMFGMIFGNNWSQRCLPTMQSSLEDGSLNMKTGE